jgi:hypothetical protein
MNRQAILIWLQQPSSVAGISAMAGAVSGILAGQLTWAQAVPVLIGGAVAIALPDNTVAKTGATALAADVVRLAAGDQGALRAAVADGAGLVAGLTAQR